MSATLTPAAVGIDADKLSAALSLVGPHLSQADHDDWCDALSFALDQADITTPKRIAAFLGQVAEESDGFTHLQEDLNYLHASALMHAFPSRFPTEASTAGYLGSPTKLANFVYANRLGNGDTASGDGSRFAGKGLIMLTGRANVTAFATASDMTAEDAADYRGTMAGACDSACWFWTTHGCNALADSWNLDAITMAVNGKAKLGLQQRIAFSNAALKALS